MDSYNQRNVSLAENVTTICVIVGALASWLSHDHIYMNIIALPVGLTAIIFSHDLTMQAKERYKHFNYNVHRGIYVGIGLLFIVFGIIGLVNR